MSQSQGEPQVYGLYAVLVHSGFSCHAGHYFCYIKVLALMRTTALICQDAASAKYTHTHTQDYNNYINILDLTLLK